MADLAKEKIVYVWKAQFNNYELIVGVHLLRDGHIFDVEICLVAAGDKPVHQKMTLLGKSDGNNLRSLLDSIQEKRQIAAAK